ncbi:hypothetical protein LC593_05995 [Nostoc sp. CHAB 5844]|nr:hypothetical protein [Nostoc sp. CHAB 5844]
MHKDCLLRLGSQRRGVSVAIFDVGASAVRWGDTALHGFPRHSVGRLCRLPHCRAWFPDSRATGVVWG